jgi:hypothetical protein
MRDRFPGLPVEERTTHIIHDCIDQRAVWSGIETPGCDYVDCTPDAVPVVSGIDATMGLYLAALVPSAIAREMTLGRTASCALLPSAIGFLAREK